MPMFDFKCPACGHILENKICKVNEKRIINCSECETQMNKMIGLSRFKMGKSCFVKTVPSRREQINSEAIMEDYKARIKGDIS